MSFRSRSRTIAATVACLLSAACRDATAPAPTSLRSPESVRLAKSGTAPSSPGIDPSAPQAPGGGGGGGGAGGGSAAAACGTLSSDIRTYNIVVYTTRVGIGFSGSAVNCGTRKVAFEVDAVDTDPIPGCAVQVPHFIAPKNTDPGASVIWSANSTLVPCQGKWHNFVLTLWDTKTKTQLATATASVFL